MKLKDVSFRNRKHAKTQVIDETGAWYTLDNAAIIMPAINNDVETGIFRMSATLDHPIRYDAMQKALAKAIERYPYYRVELRRGFFWYYFEPSKTLPVLEADEGSPSMGYSIHRRGNLLFRVRIKAHRVAVEFNHTLTDGTGAINFLKTLLVLYFKECGIEVQNTGDVLLPGQPISEEEFEDAYHKHYKADIPGPLPLPKAYHLNSKLLDKHTYRVTYAHIPLQPLLDYARQHKASVTEVLVAALMEAYIEAWKRTPPKKRDGNNIAVEVPVNMRKFYPTKTLKNFSLYVMVCLDPRLGNWTFEELVEYVHNVMRIENDERMIARQIARNAGGGRNIIVRLVPLIIKDFFARLFFSTLGQSLITTFISNLGAVTLPEEIAKHVRRFDFIPAPSADTKTNASCLSWQDTFYISFGSRVESTEIEQHFFSRIASLNIPVYIDLHTEVG